MKCRENDKKKVKKGKLIVKNSDVSDSKPVVKNSDVLDSKPVVLPQPLNSTNHLVFNHI